MMIYLEFKNEGANRRVRVTPEGVDFARAAIKGAFGRQGAPEPHLGVLTPDGPDARLKQFIDLSGKSAASVVDPVDETKTLRRLIVMFYALVDTPTPQWKDMVRAGPPAGGAGAGAGADAIRSASEVVAEVSSNSDESEDDSSDDEDEGEDEDEDDGSSDDEDDSSSESEDDDEEEEEDAYETATPPPTAPVAPPVAKQSGATAAPPTVKRPRADDDPSAPAPKRSRSGTVTPPPSTAPVAPPVAKQSGATPPPKVKSPRADDDVSPKKVKRARSGANIQIASRNTGQNKFMHAIPSGRLAEVIGRKLSGGEDSSVGSRPAFVLGDIPESSILYRQLNDEARKTWFSAPGSWEELQKLAEGNDRKAIQAMVDPILTAWFDSASREDIMRQLALKHEKDVEGYVTHTKAKATTKATAKASGGRSRNNVAKLLKELKYHNKRAAKLAVKLEKAIFG